MDTIDRRLQVLEGHYLRTRRVNRVLALVLVAIVCIGGAQSAAPPGSAQQTPTTVPQPERRLQNGGVTLGGDWPRTVEANQFVLFDRHGRSRATLVVNDDGPALSMFDEKGQKKLELSQTTQGSALELLGADGSPVVSLRVNGAAPDAKLEIQSSNGSSSMTSSGLSVKDREENQRLLLSLINGSFPVLGINQSGKRNGPPSVEITASDDGSRLLTMHDESGHSLFSVSAAKDTFTTLSMRHPDHERSLQISSGNKEMDGPLIAFFAPANQDGTGGLLPFLQFGIRKDHEPYIRIVDGSGRALFMAPTK